MQVEQPAERKLTKKEAKAKAFRASKGKGKKDEAQADVPDEENLDDDGAGGDDGEDGEKKTKKRKRDDAAEPKDGATPDAVVEGDGERKKKRQRGKKKSLQGQGPRADGKPRLVLFAGTSSGRHPRARC